jgi:hypothetical protein
MIIILIKHTIVYLINDNNIYKDSIVHIMDCSYKGIDILEKQFTHTLVVLVHGERICILHSVLT